jgi:hypothetical protein
MLFVPFQTLDKFLFAHNIGNSFSSRDFIGRKIFVMI